jgi:hypothetical protein
LCAAGAFAQSVTISIVASDGGAATTNTIQVAAVRVQGLLAMWQDDCKAKTNATPPAQALTFGQFIVQEIRDRGQDYQNKGVVADMLTWGITNAPAKLIANWPNLTAAQKTNAVNYLKQIGE